MYTSHHSTVLQIEFKDLNTRKRRGKAWSYEKPIKGNTGLLSPETRRKKTNSVVTPSPVGAVEPPPLFVLPARDSLNLAAAVGDRG
ncbi:hypothetical protein SESBI_28170 [Sesbania bispinosa]|nr:hypothetical protein SESBI_28170 [Sesbania bispinosa]